MIMRLVAIVFLVLAGNGLKDQHSHVHTGGIVKESGEVMLIDASGREERIEITSQTRIMRLGRPSDLAIGQELIAIGTQSRKGFVLKRVVRAPAFKKIFLEGMGKWERMKCRWKIGTLVRTDPITLKIDDREEEFPIQGTSLRIFLPLDIHGIATGEENAVAGGATPENSLKAVLVLVGPGARDALPQGPHSMNR